MKTFLKSGTLPTYLSCRLMFSMKTVLPAGIHSTDLFFDLTLSFSFFTGLFLMRFFLSSSVMNELDRCNLSCRLALMSVSMNVWKFSSERFELDLVILKFLLMSILALFLVGSVSFCCIIICLYSCGLKLDMMGWAVMEK